MIDLDEIWRKYVSDRNILESRPNFRFDPIFYRHNNSLLAQDPVSLTQHYHQHGRDQAPNEYHKLRDSLPDHRQILNELIVAPDLRSALETNNPEAYELAYELIRLGEPFDVRVSNFSEVYYKVAHPDVRDAGVDPLQHYMFNGYKECRRTLAELRNGQHVGKRPFRPDRPTCLICFHEFSRTGAPIVGRDIVREASQTHNVVVAALRDGEILDSCLEYACEIIITSLPQAELPFLKSKAIDEIDYAILNSVESYRFVPFLVAHDIPYAGYIHEYAWYTFPYYKSTFMALFADLLVFSSEHVRDSWMGRLIDIEFDVDRHTTVLPQRNLTIGHVDKKTVEEARKRLSDIVGRDLSNVRLICGAGHHQWRKGTDLFASAAQVCRQRDPNTVFLWIGDGLNCEDMSFGVWVDYQMRQLGVNDPEGNLFIIPASPAYADVLAASDAMFVSSRLDPLPNVAFDALESGCRIVLFEGSSGFGDPPYLKTNFLVTVPYADPSAAVTTLLELPRKTPHPGPSRPAEPVQMFRLISEGLTARLRAQRYFVRGASKNDVPILFTMKDEDRDLRVREREKMMRYRRRFVWRDVTEAKTAVATSDNWIHRNCDIVPCSTTDEENLPTFSMHIHAYYTDELEEDLRLHRAYQTAKRIIVTTDTERKSDEIREIMARRNLTPEVIMTPNRGRDILPFLNMFTPDGVARDDEIWCHLHQKKSRGVTDSGRVWRKFLLNILLGDEDHISNSMAQIAQDQVGLVAPFDPYFVPWNSSRNLLAKFAPRLPGPLPTNPLLFPVGNMFLVRARVVRQMLAIFGANYPWPNEPIPNDGTEFHLIERLWPAATACCGMRSVFVHKSDQLRV